jgi:cysteine-rich repeat protein
MREARLLVWSIISIGAGALVACSSDNGPGRDPGRSQGGSTNASGSGGTGSPSSGAGGRSSGSGGTGITLGGGSPKMDCTGMDPPPGCPISKPGCGDGKINLDGEECDDGNSISGDGCSGICKV